MPSGQPLLTAAMIVRDEEEHLDDCLSSLQGVVDDIVVVDTGSTDASIAIARSHGAQVYQEEWVDDFARARNRALDRARGRWILYIDADERLRPVTRDEVVALLEPAEEVAFRVLCRQFVGATLCREFRLWRNDPRIRFEGVIHEKVMPAIQAVAATESRGIGLCDLVLDHVGYEGDQTRKHRRNLPLLRTQLAAEPRNVFNWRHLATCLAGLGAHDESEEALARALELVRAAASPPSGGSLVYNDAIRLQRSPARRDKLLAEAVATYPHDPLLIWTQALVEIDSDDPAAGLASLDRLTGLDPESLDDTLGYDERLFGTFIYEAQGLALFRSARFREAAAAYGAAERSEPDNAEHRARRLMAEHLAERSRTNGSSRSVDLAGTGVRFDASDAVRVQAIDAVVGELSLHHGEAVLRITFDADAEPLPSDVHQHADGDVRAWWNGDELLLGHGSLAAHVGTSTAHIGGDKDLARGFRQLFPYVITHLLAPRDLFVLHGGAIQRDDHAVLVLGGTGTGKSTLVASAPSGGWSALADDLVVVRLGGDGPEVTGVPKPLAVPEDVVDMTGLTARPIDNDPRHRWRVDIGPSDREWYPVSATLVSAHGDRASSELRDLTSRQLFEWLLFSFLSRHEQSRLRRFLPVAAELTCRRGWELRHGANPSVRVEEVCSLLGQVSQYAHGN